MSTNNKNLYIGLTIGPIDHTLKKVKSTRALFTGSYLFSFITKSCINGLIEKGIPKEHILTPSTLKVENGAPEAGYYADRLIMKADEGNFATFQKVLSGVLENMAEKISVENTRLGSKKEVLDYLRQYFQLYCFEKTFEHKDSCFEDISKILHLLDLQRQFPSQDNDLLVQYLNKKRPSFLIEDAFGKQQRFPSIIEISTHDLRVKDPKEYQKIISKSFAPGNEEQSDIEQDQNVIKALSRHPSFKDSVRAYHKYVAIVYADGDGIGQYINSLQGNADRFLDFSDQLFKFSVEVKDMIKEFGGAPIYLGGEDFLFLAPLANQITDNGPPRLRTIFNLISEIDQLFHEEYFPNENALPTFSSGVSFTYYKYPLNEAKALSEQIKDDVKKAYAPEKNAVGFHLRKHSGAHFELSFSKKSNAYQDFLNLIKDQTASTTFLNSITHRLDFHKTTLHHLVTLPDWQNRLKYFFYNNFDEQEHKDNKAFFDQLIQFTQALFEEENDKEAALPRLYATLRFIHFLRSKENE